METNKELTMADLPLRVTIVDEKTIATLRSDSDFLRLGVEVLKDIGMTTSLLFSIIPQGPLGNRRVWSRDEAIIGGQLIRLNKLQRAMLQQICEDRLEIAHIIGRCVFETAVNLIALSRNKNLCQEYVEYSFGPEKKLVELIRQNVSKRGSTLPIERRILASIEN